MNNDKLKFKVKLIDIDSRFSILLNVLNISPTFKTKNNLTKILMNMSSYFLYMHALFSYSDKMTKILLSLSSFSIRNELSLLFNLVAR